MNSWFLIKGHPFNTLNCIFNFKFEITLLVMHFYNYGGELVPILKTIFQRNKIMCTFMVELEVIA